MAAVNKIILVGNLGADPEVRYMTNGDAVANVRLATTESWKDRNSGEKHEHTEWHRLVFYRKLAEVVGQYLKKGASIYVEGRLRTRKWNDKDGVERYTTEIECNEMQMLGSRPQGGERGESRGGGGGGSQESQHRREPSTTSSKPSFDDLDDDIPFLRANFDAEPMLRRRIIRGR